MNYIWKSICSLLFLMYCFVVGNTLHAQSIIPRFETIGVNEGLSQSSVYSVHQDKAGFIWVGTADGLNRYDGTTVKTFRVPSSPTLLRSSYVRGNIFEDRQGNLWFANESGIHCYNAAQEKIITSRVFPIRDYHGNAFEIASLEDGRTLWIVSNSYGFLSYDIISGAFHQYPFHRAFFKVAQAFPMVPATDDHHGIYFSMYVGDGLFRFDTHTRRLTHAFANTSDRRVFFGRGRHYLIKNDRIVLYDSVTRTEQTLITTLGSKERFGAFHLLEDKWNRVWITSSGDGLVCIDLISGQRYRYTHSNVKLKSLPIDLLTTLFIDKADNLWIGTDGGGVCHLDLKPPRFELFPLNEGDYPFLKDYFTKCFYEDAEGKIWFGTHNNGFNIFDPISGNVRNYSSQQGNSASLPGNIVGVIHEDKEGTMWIGHCMGFSFFNRNAGSFSTIPINPKPLYNPWNIYGFGLCQLQDGRMLGATYSGMVIFTRGSDRQWKGRSFTVNPEFGNMTTSIVQLQNGTIWMANPIHGLKQIEEEADSFKIAGSFFPGIDIRSLHIDETNPEIIWLCTANSIIGFNTYNKQYTSYNEKDGMVNSYAYGILEDASHNFWVSTNGGLEYFNRHTNAFTNFSGSDGLQSNEFNTGAFYKGRSGTMYFGGIRGFNWFKNAASGNRSGAIPGVALLDVRVNDAPIYRDSSYLFAHKLELPHYRNNIAFSFASLDFTRPQANKIAYMLHGWDRSWIITSDRTVHYANLPPGKYLLKVRGSNAAGIWSKEETLSIVITAPFWKAIWFYICVAIMVVCLFAIVIIVVFRRRVRLRIMEYEQQRALAEERSRISKDMHDEIGSGLTRIAMMGELINQNATYAVQITDSARRLVQNMSEIVWALNPSQDNLETLLSYLREQANQFLEPFGIAYSIKFPEDVPNIALTNVQRRNIYLTAKESINNSLKHAQATHIAISAEIIAGILHLCVADNGLGFSSKAIRFAANGLKNMRRRMEDIGGTFTIDTGSGGTKICCTFPLSGPARKAARHSITTFFTRPTLRKKDIFDA